MYDFRLYDAVELGIVGYKAIKAYPASSLVQYGNKPAFVFVGDSFDSDPVLRQVRSLFLDFFRGIQVDNINLKGLDRLIFMTHLPCGQPGAPGLSHKLLFRQYAVRFKKSGTRIPRAELHEMGPSLDLELRRRHQAAPDLEKEAITRPKIAPKKEKNVGSDTLDGKIGRIYMPKQDVGSMALHKMKGLKRERREAKAKSGESSKILSKKAKSDTAADD
jgi:ribosome production factor 2